MDFALVIMFLALTPGQSNSSYLVSRHPDRAACEVARETAFSKAAALARTGDEMDRYAAVCVPFAGGEK